MPGRRMKLCTVALVSLAVGGALTACGDEVTAARDFYSVARYQGSETEVNGKQQVQLIADGSLDIDPTKGSAFGTLFRERCTNTVAVGGVWICTAVINTGAHIYVARGATSDPIQEHTLLLLAGNHGSLTIKGVGEGAESHKVKLSLRP